MAVTTAKLVQTKFVEGAEATQFTATSVTIIDAVTLVNTGTAAALVSLGIVPDGGTAASSNRLVFSHAIRANESFLCPEIVGQVMNANEFLSGISSVSDSVTLMVSGRVIT